MNSRFQVSLSLAITFAILISFQSDVFAQAKESDKKGNNNIATGYLEDNSGVETEPEGVLKYGKQETYVVSPQDEYVSDDPSNTSSSSSATQTKNYSGGDQGHTNFKQGDQGKEETYTKQVEGSNYGDHAKNTRTTNGTKHINGNNGVNTENYGTPDSYTSNTQPEPAAGRNTTPFDQNTLLNDPFSGTNSYQSFNTGSTNQAPATSTNAFNTTDFSNVGVQQQSFTSGPTTSQGNFSNQFGNTQSFGNVGQFTNP